MNQLRTPLFDQLKKHFENKPLSFHVPGHKYGELLQQDDGVYFKELLKLDATELSGLDDLHSPEGVILEAEQLLAELYGVRKSYFLVNGSTVGNLAMILAAVKESGKVLVQRNCHKSILNGITLAKADPIFLGPDFNEEWKVAGGVSLETVKEAILLYPDAKALILTYPNYYGMVNELEEIIEFAHNKGIPVLIDEAHGAHFVGADCFPPSAVKLKADIVVQSAHKTLPAMTMGAYLHFNSKFISESAVSHYLQMLQSSSPSYLIMASLDIARSYLASFSEFDADCLSQRIKKLRDRLNQIKGIRVLSYKEYEGDPLKITLQSTTAMSGFDVQGVLEREGIYSEMADPFNVLLVFPLLKSNMDYPVEKIVMCLKEGLKTSTFPQNQERTVHFKKRPVSRLTLNSEETLNLNKEFIHVDEAEGKICAQHIIPYPPGIPLLFPGETIVKEDILHIKLLLEAGARFQGEGKLKSGEIEIFKI